MLGDFTRDQLAELLSSRRHSPLVQRRRAVMVASRVRMVAAILAILTLLWIQIDPLVFEWPLWSILTAGRVFAGAGFLVVVCMYRDVESMPVAYRALAILFTILTAFYLFSYPFLEFDAMASLAIILASSYAFLPFIMVTGLAIFPLTALEGVCFAIPLIGIALFAALSEFHGMLWSNYMGAMWLLGLVAIVAVVAAMSQLCFLLTIVTEAAHDSLTGTITRAYGEELLTTQYYQSERHGVPLAIGFVDLDDFKSVNDTFGHEEGDRLLKEVAGSLCRSLRGGDMIVRWGGEELLLILPHTDAAGAETPAARLGRVGFGVRLDGEPITVSMGIAERKHDVTQNLLPLVEIADDRMYAAKEDGKNHIVSCGDRVIRWGDAGPKKVALTA